MLSAPQPTLCQTSLRPHLHNNASSFSTIFTAMFFIRLHSDINKRSQLRFISNRF